MARPGWEGAREACAKGPSPALGSESQVLRVGAQTPAARSLSTGSSAPGGVLPQKGAALPGPKGPREDRCADTTGSREGLLAGGCGPLSGGRMSGSVGDPRPQGVSRQPCQCTERIHGCACMYAATRPVHAGLCAGACVNTGVPRRARARVLGREEMVQDSAPAPNLCFLVAPPARARLWRSISLRRSGPSHPILSRGLWDRLPGAR